MENLLELVLGLILGAIVMYWIVGLFRKRKKQELTEHQSSVLLEKIRSVCKLITVEGEFAEIYKYENTKQQFLSLLTSRKKALIVINAKAQIGYDLSKLKLEADTARKKIIVTNFPQPEVLSIEPELEFYDIQNDLFNLFTPNDLTLVTREAKAHIRNKIPESGLMESAKKDAIEAILLMEKIVETIGWKLDYSALEINEDKRKLLKDET